LSVLLIIQLNIIQFIVGRRTGSGVKGITETIVCITHEVMCSVYMMRCVRSIWSIFYIQWHV